MTPTAALAIVTPTAALYALGLDWTDVVIMRRDLLNAIATRELLRELGGR